MSESDAGGDPPALPLSSRSQRVGLGAIALLLLARVLFLASHLRYPDLALDYPFLGGDGLEWILNGLARAGWPVRSPDRAPLLPLLLAALERGGMLAWFPPLHQLVPAGGLLALYLSLARRHGARLALLATAIPLLGAAATGISLEVMADTLAATLLFFALLAFLAAARDPRWYLAAGVLAAASALTQPAALLLPLPAALTLAIGRRAHLRRAEPWVAALLFVGAVTAPLLVTGLRALGGGASGTLERAWTLLAPQVDHLDFYAGASLAMWGLPALLLAAAGAWRLLRHGGEPALPLVGTIVTLAGFFVFVYSYPGQRFLLYLLLPVTRLVVEGLAALRRPAWQLAAGLLAIAWAAWPVPGAPAAESRFALLPLPGLYVDPAAPAGHRLVRMEPAAAWRDSPWRRVLGARSRRAVGSPLDPAVAVGTGRIVLLAPEGVPSAYARQLVLSAVLRRRVTMVPAELYPVDWWGWRRHRFVGVAGGYALFRVRPLAETPPALLAFLAEDGAWGPLAAGAPQAAPPPRACQQAAWRTAVQVAALGPPGDPLLAVVSRRPPGDWERLVPFAATTSRLFVLVGGHATAARRELGRGAPPQRLWRGPGARVVRDRLYGWSALVTLPNAVGADCDAAVDPGLPPTRREPARSSAGGQAGANDGRRPPYSP